MTKRTKKAGIVGKYGTRYGASLQKQIRKMEVFSMQSTSVSAAGRLSLLLLFFLLPLHLHPNLSLSAALQAIDRGCVLQTLTRSMEELPPLEPVDVSGDQSGRSPPLEDLFGGGGGELDWATCRCVRPDQPELFVPPPLVQCDP
ncbi:60S ribosomal protein L37a-1 [Canna indica]|uniref:60S ribosomal protein L37a-1 n=1 Tax=Canna indica TaxID=4628 RepID=A0AAQ3PZW6_9LILI|nr:60S ribosomal protein L37a-1 [Canna indica]